MSGIPGTNVAAMVVPIDTADLYATHSDKYGRGGFRVEDTTLTRDAITTLRRREGMWVRVLADGKLYQLGSGLSNADWSEVTLGGNATGVNTGDETTATIKTKLGITTLSGSNTGDQVIPTTLPASDVSAWAKAATKPAYTYTEVGAQVAGDYITGIGSASGSNTGDETTATIKTKLGITTLSGSNTGDETTATVKTKLGITTLSGSNTGDNATNTQYSGLVSNATHTGDATGATALTVVKLNGTLLSDLATGVLKNTTATGVPSIATGADLPVMSATVGGAVPTPPNNTTTFLRGDGTFATPPAASVDLANDLVIHGVTVGKGTGTATDYNTVLGDAAGGANTTGDFNTFIGYSAGAANTSGRRNSAFGSWALQNNTTGIRNSAQGSFALGQNTEGSQNTAVGETSGNSLGAVVGSDNNTTIGYVAGGPIGIGALDPQVVAGNTFIGSRSNGAADGGNVFQATCNTSGSNNTFLGYLTMGATATDSNEIVIGANAVGLGSNTTVIGNASTTRTTLMGGLNLPTAGGRITGDFSNATFANRVMFQTSTANAATVLGILPNGSSGVANVSVASSSDPTNTSVGQIAVSAGVDMRISSAIWGTGTYLPMTFYTGGLERIRLNAAGDTTFYGDVVLNQNKTGAVSMHIQNTNVTAGNSASLYVSQGTAQLRMLASYGNGYIGTVNSGELNFSTGAVDKLRIGVDGTVEVITPAGLGYGAGAGGSVTQATSKATPVTLNKPCGRITMSAAALAASTPIAFRVNNSLVSASDNVILTMVNTVSGATNYNYWIGDIADGSFSVGLKNISAGSLSDAVVLNFAIIKGATS